MREPAGNVSNTKRTSITIFPSDYRSTLTWNSDAATVPMYDFQTTAKRIERTSDVRYRRDFTMRCGWNMLPKNWLGPRNTASAAIVIKLPIVKLMVNLAGRTRS